MAERTTDRTRDVGVDEDVGVSDDFGVDDSLDPDTSDLGVDTGDLGSGFSTDATTDSGTTTDAGSSLGGRLGRRAASVFSPTSFAVHLGAALVGVFVVGNIIPVLPFAGFVGLFLMAGLLGLISSEPRYLEAAVAGGASGALALLVGSVTLSVLTAGLLPAVGAAVGAVAALGGFYAGRDLRDGLTKDL